jgi:hypothetical protein
VQDGDISADFQPCLLVVFEGLLGLPSPQELGRKWGWKRRKSTAKHLVAQYELNDLLLGQIRRTPYPVEVVTFLGPDVAEAVEERLEDVHALVRRVWSTTPQELARIHITMPDVAAIYDPDPMRATLTYGQLGRHMLPQNAPRFGEQ